LETFWEKKELYDRISIIKDNKYFLTFTSKNYSDCSAPVYIQFKIINNQFNEKEFSVYYDIPTFCYEGYPYHHHRIINNVFYIKKVFYFIFSLTEFPPCYQSYLKLGYININDLKPGENRLINVINISVGYGDIYFTHIKYLYENIIEENNKKNMFVHIDKGLKSKQLKDILDGKKCIWKMIYLIINPFLYLFLKEEYIY